MKAYIRVGHEPGSSMGWVGSENFQRCMGRVGWVHCSKCL